MEVLQEKLERCVSDPEKTTKETNGVALGPYNWNGNQEGRTRRWYEEDVSDSYEFGKFVEAIAEEFKISPKVAVLSKKEGESSKTGEADKNSRTSTSAGFTAPEKMKMEEQMCEEPQVKEDETRENSAGKKRHQYSREELFNLCPVNDYLC